MSPGESQCLCERPAGWAVRTGDVTTAGGFGGTPGSDIFSGGNESIQHGLQKHGCSDGCACLGACAGMTPAWEEALRAALGHHGQRPSATYCVAH